VKSKQKHSAESGRRRACHDATDRLLRLVLAQFVAPLRACFKRATRPSTLLVARETCCPADGGPVMAFRLVHFAAVVMRLSGFRWWCQEHGRKEGIFSGGVKAVLLNGQRRR
jgi:hypothetical protein